MIGNLVAMPSTTFFHLLGPPIVNTEELLQSWMGANAYNKTAWLEVVLITCAHELVGQRFGDNAIPNLHPGGHNDVGQHSPVIWH
jgi:hypothetical protein